MRACLVLPKYGVSIDDPCCYPLGVMYLCAALMAKAATVSEGNILTTTVPLGQLKNYLTK